ncbi:MAG: hypothetical protein QOI38_62 [Sphingomonadales bacterium]|nr:hypothetical protein [Sphingomonadales bacterium]
MTDCDFCRELEGSPGTRFHALYAGVADTRIVIETCHFAALPTLGQLFSGSMLIIPKEHVETSARVAPHLRPELGCLLARVVETVRPYGSPVFFEHGALSCTGGSCGIYHAHIHVMPLPAPVTPRLFLGERARISNSLEGALAALSSSEQYLLFGRNTEVAYSEVDQLDFQPPSQFFRRALAKRFHTAVPWDWRLVQDAEPELLATLSLFGGGHVPERPGDPR